MIIAHLADIHIYSPATLKYKHLLDTAVAKIKELNVDIIVVAGDVFHNKNHATAAELIKAREFLTSLAAIAHLVVIPGNHDVDIEYKDNEHTLISALDLKNITYFRYGGYYKDTKFDNLYWHVVAPDGKINEAASIKPSDTNIIIGLFHDEIAGAIMPNGRDCASKLRVTEFDDDTAAMGGHIHKYQKIANKIWYCGSLIQQNLGESEYPHGFLLWNIPAPHRIAVNFIEIENPSAGITITIDDLTAPIKILSKTPDHWQIKFKGAKCAQSTEIIKKYTEVLGISPKNITYKPAQQPIESAGRAPKVQYSDYDAIIADYLKTKEYDDKTVAEIIKIHTKYAQNLSTSARTTIKLKNLKFDNILCYIAGNINFSALEGGLSCIEASNGMGKSSVIKIIFIALYGKASYGDISCRHADSVSATTEIEFSLNTDANVYKIVRKFGKTNTVENYINDSLTKIPINIGDLNTTMSLSFLAGIHELLSSTMTKRLDILSKTLNLGRFDELCKDISDKRLELRTLMTGCNVPKKYNKEEMLAAIETASSQDNIKDKLLITEYLKSMKSILDNYNESLSPPVQIEVVGEHGITTVEKIREMHCNIVDTGRKIKTEFKPIALRHLVGRCECCDGVREQNEKLAEMHKKNIAQHNANVINIVGLLKHIMSHYTSELAKYSDQSDSLVNVEQLKYQLERIIRYEALQLEHTYMTYYEDLIKRGIAKKLITDQIIELENSANFILANCNHDADMFIKINPVDYQVSYYNTFTSGKLTSTAYASGAQSAMISVALQLALWEQSAGIVIDGIFLDETIATLDEAHIKKFMEYMLTLQQPNIILIISNDPLINDMIDNKLHIVDNTITNGELVIKPKETFAPGTYKRQGNSVYCSACDTHLKITSLKRHELTKKHLANTK
jgi:DNA repair exonuclease SbcCD nuclease subunit/ABC-type Mn2+/Zn2+ transport system ATPase subunit